MDIAYERSYFIDQKLGLNASVNASVNFLFFLFLILFLLFINLWKTRLKLEKDRPNQEKNE